jgi:glycosyltransferase involved in cell wall biosynthesis
MTSIPPGFAHARAREPVVAGLPARDLPAGMRIVLSNSSWKWGGVHFVTESLARGLAARGHDVTLFCRPGSELESRMRGTARLEPILRGMDFGPRAIARAALALRRHRTEVVVVLMDKDLRLTGVAARLLRIPVVVRRANDRPLASARARFFYRALATRVVANSAATRSTLLASAPALARRGVEVIHNGIDVEAFARAAPADLGLPENAIAFGFLGRFEVRKGLHELMRAWPAVAGALPDALLVLVGRGDLDDEIRAWARRVPGVLCAGYRRDVAAVLRALDVLVIPSHWEGFGLVAAEGMAAGIPVVASNTSSLPELIRDGVSGRLVPPGDAGALAQAMIELGSDEALRGSLGDGGQASARREFPAERMVERWDELLRDVVA